MTHTNPLTTAMTNLTLATLRRAKQLLTNKLLAILTIALMGAVASTPAHAQTKVTYYHNDLAGSPVAASDASGTIIWRESYRPYGERLNNDAASQNNSQWYTGHRQDADTGLVYMGARHYDPLIGRFLSRDPMGFIEDNPHSFNRYAYANNNPVKYIDPDGRDVRLIGPAIIVTALVVGSSVVANDAGIKERFVAGVSESARRLRQAVGSLTFSNGTEQPGAADGQPREGEAGGEGAGKGFSEKDKEIIRKRDGYKCVFCKTETTDESGPDKSEIDHSQPKSKGGNNSENNGQNTCRTCNRQKGAKSTGEFLDWLFGQNK